MAPDAPGGSPPPERGQIPPPLGGGSDTRPPIPNILPLLPTRDVAVFPGIIASLTIGRPGSRKLLEESLPQSKIIGVFTQKNPDHDNPSPEELQRVGVAASVLKLIRQS